MEDEKGKRRRSKTEYVTIRIPKELAEDIDEILRSGIHGYRSRAELANEAIRLRLEALRVFQLIK